MICGRASTTRDFWPVNLAKHGGGLRTPILERAREAMRTERAVEIEYEDVEGRVTSRTVWPIQLAYYEQKEIVVAWCCLREDYRLFRSDRIKSFELTEQRYGAQTF